MIGNRHSGWEALQGRVDALIELNAKLASENRMLRQQQQDWARERAALLQKHELAKSRVEAMIDRLRGLEQG